MGRSAGAWDGSASGVLERLRALQRQVSQLRTRVDELSRELRDGRLSEGLAALVSETTATSRRSAMRVATMGGERAEMLLLTERSRTILAEHQREQACEREALEARASHASARCWPSRVA